MSLPPTDDPASPEPVASEVIDGSDGNACIHLLVTERATRSAIEAAFHANGRVTLAHATYDAFRDVLSASQGGGLQVAVIEVDGEDHSGLRRVADLCVRAPQVPIIVVGDRDSVPLCGRLMRAGVHDYLVKPVVERSLLDAAASALSRGPLLDGILQEISRTGQKVLRLTVREREVLDLVVEGDQSKTIAKRLGISEKTVEAHRYKVMQKMECGSVAHVVRLFAKYQLWTSLVEARRRWSISASGNGDGQVFSPSAPPSSR